MVYTEPAGLIIRKGGVSRSYEATEQTNVFKPLGKGRDSTSSGHKSHKPIRAV